jgi:transcriptional regulator with XRE-family HTH domain
LKKNKSSTDQGPFAKKVTELRVRKGMAKSKMSGISSSYMQKIENEGIIPSGEMIATLAAALGDGKTDMH